MHEVVKLELASNIPVMLRELADDIEAGEHKDLSFVVAVLVTKKPGAITTEVRGWGQCSPLEAAGALTWAANNLAGV